MPLNLVQHRGDINVWDTVGPGARDEALRWTGLTMACGLVLYGLRRRSVPGLLFTVGGAALAWWASGSIEERSRRRGRLLSFRSERGLADRVTEASEESFPASDSPSWTSTTGSAAGQSHP